MQLGVVARIVFQVGVLNQQDVARGPIETGAHRRALALIAIVVDHDRARLALFGLEQFARPIGGAVVDDDDFIGQADRAHLLQESPEWWLLRCRPE